MKTILVTGAAGFIGSHLCERLLVMGHKVIGIDNYSLGKMEHITFLNKFTNFKFHYVDIYCLNKYFFLYDYQFDTVFHLAANSDISIQDPAVELRNTFHTTYNILEFCREKEIKEIIFPSSGSIYGEECGVIAEDFGPLFPISHYAAAKLSSEAFISSFSAMYDIKAWICRFPNVIGGHATHGAIFDFVNRIRENPNILKVLGDGSQRKPYLYVQDLIQAMLFIWENAQNRLNYFNIAGIGTTSVKEIAEMVIEEMGTNTIIAYTGGDRGWKGDVPQYQCNTNKLKQLGWSPVRDSNDSVKLAIKEIINETKT